MLNRALELLSRALELLNSGLELADFVLEDVAREPEQAISGPGPPGPKTPISLSRPLLAKMRPS